MALFLVTGAAGFVGSALTRALLERGDRVRAFDNLSTGLVGNLDSLLPRCEFHEGDVRDAAACAAACRGVDYIFHQAALASVPRSIKDPAATTAVNVDGTVNLLLAARDAGVKRVMFAGSSSVYGNGAALPKNEEMLPNPLSPYAASKLSGELYMAAFFRVYGLETVTMRYFNVFGPRQDPNSPYSAALARFIAQMLRGEQPTIFGDGEQSRDFTYIDNVVSANLLACAAPAEAVAGRTFNVATGQRFSLNATFEMLSEITGYRGKPRYAAPRAGDVKHSLADIRAAREAFGYEPKIDFREGLRRTVEWYRTTEAAQPARSGVSAK